MKGHCCHCGFREHLNLAKAKKLGFVGMVFFVLHLLFHVVECLIIPSILVGLGGHLTEDSAVAIDVEPVVDEAVVETKYLPRYDFQQDVAHPFENIDFYQICSTS